MTEVPNRLPSQWTQATLSDIASLRKEPVDPKERPHDEFNYLSIGNIESETGKLVDFRRTLGKDIDSTKLAFTEDDILYSRLRPYLNKVFMPDFDGISATDLLPIRPKEGVEKKYLGYFLRTRRVVEYANQRLRGIQLPRLPTRDLLALAVPLAPSNEQRRIVAKIEALFAESQTAREALDKIPLLLRRFRQSVLTRAFRGELIQPVTRDEPIERNRKNITTQHINAHQAEELFEVPITWAWVNADEVCRKITDGEHNKPPTGPHGVPLLSAKNIRDGYLDFGDVDYVNEEVAARCLRRCDPEPGDVLMVSVGATIGRISPVVEGKRFCLQRTVGLFKPLKEAIDTMFLYYFLKSDVCQAQIARMSRATAITHFNINKMKSISIPLAPKNEQRMIVARIQTLFSIAENAENAVNIAKERSSKIDEAILSKAFRGELVSQDPDDEPASRILERILSASRQSEGCQKEI